MNDASQYSGNHIIPDSISDRRRIWEIIAVVVTAIGKIVFMDILKMRLQFVIISVLAWTVYIILRRTKLKEVLKYWGFRQDNFKEVVKIVLPFGLITAPLCLLIGYFNSTLNFTWHIIPIIILYPIWGILQQFLLIGLVSGNLRDFKRNNFKDSLIIISSAVLFAAVHYPYVWLMIPTFVLALFYGHVYKRVKNLYVLGIFHGWLGAICFYTLVGRDPYLEAVSNIIN
jgi:Type II CAAX prenyl endopeptidase Rce1-like